MYNCFTLQVPQPYHPPAWAPESSQTSSNADTPSSNVGTVGSPVTSSPVIVVTTTGQQRSSCSAVSEPAETASSVDDSDDAAAEQAQKRISAIKFKIATLTADHKDQADSK